jgi:hypothetical protein
MQHRSTGIARKKYARAASLSRAYRWMKRAGSPVVLRFLSKAFEASWLIKFTRLGDSYVRRSHPIRTNSRTGL